MSARDLICLGLGMAFGYLTAWLISQLGRLAEALGPYLDR